LKESISKNGYWEEYPIIVNDNNEILDGHSRWKACQELGIQPTIKVKHFESKEEVRFVIETNLNRRHLNAFQKAELALKLIELEKTKRGRKPEEISSESEENSVKVDTWKVASDKVGVSEDTISRTKVILEKGDEELIEKCRRGEISVNEAYRRTKTPNVLQEEFRFREEASKLPEEDVKRIYANTQMILQTLNKYNAFPKVQRYLVNFLCRLITDENEIPKRISFNEKLIPKILEGKKTTTIREEKLCEVGELVTLKSKEFYAIAKIVNIYSKKLGELSDGEAHKDGFNNIEELKEFWRKELKKKWDEDRLVWIIEFQLL
jgi:uncharacterized protein YqfB (UPF0267 family)